MIRHSHTGILGIALIDSLLTKLVPKANVRLATTAALAAGTYANGTAGVGATFTITATGTLTVDGSLVALNDRIWVKNQASALQNGIFKCTTAGATGVSAVLTRDTASDTGAEILGEAALVTEGTVNAGKAFANVNPSAPIMGTTGIYYSVLKMVHSVKSDALPQVLTDAATVAFDVALGLNATVTLGGNRTLGAPTNLFPGAKGIITLTQDGTGTRTLAYAAAYKWVGGSAGTLSTPAASVDDLEWYSPDGVTVHLRLTKAWA